jgi:hypothetical protein
MILQDADRQIIFSACQFLPICVEAIEAELCAWREGLELALVRSDLPITNHCGVRLFPGGSSCTGENWRSLSLSEYHLRH